MTVPTSAKNCIAWCDWPPKHLQVAEPPREAEALVARELEVVDCGEGWRCAGNRHVSAPPYDTPIAMHPQGYMILCMGQSRSGACAPTCGDGAGDAQHPLANLHVHLLAHAPRLFMAHLWDALLLCAGALLGGVGAGGRRGRGGRAGDLDAAEAQHVHERRLPPRAPGASAARCNGHGHNCCARSGGLGLGRGRGRPSRQHNACTPRAASVGASQRACSGGACSGGGVCSIGSRHAPRADFRRLRFIRLTHLSLSQSAYRYAPRAKSPRVHFHPARPRCRPDHVSND